MARILCDGNTKVTWVPTIANISAPSAGTELSAASSVDLEGFITPDGVNLGLSEAVVDMSVLASTGEYEGPGRYKITMDLTMQRDGSTAADKAWAAMVRGTQGFIVIRRNKPAGTAYAAADNVEVYTVTIGKRQNQKPAKNTLVTFTCHLYASGPDNDSAAVAA